MNDQTKQAMQMALEALEMYCYHGVIFNTFETAKSLREALAQPQGSWVDLTDDEMQSLWVKSVYPQTFAHALVTKFKSKNTPPVVPQGEPVAWMDIDGNVCDHNEFGCFNIPLYTTTPSVETITEWHLIAQQYKTECEQDIEAMRIETLDKVIHLLTKSPDLTVAFKAIAEMKGTK